MNKEQQIKEMAEILKNSATESAKYFQAEVKKAFGNGAKNLKRSDCEKSIHDIAAEALYNAGYCNQKKAVEEFLQELKSELVSMTGMFTDELGFALSLEAVIRMIDGMFERKYNQDD